jgi:glutamate transport system substrate-binding protein
MVDRRLIVLLAVTLLLSACGGRKPLFGEVVNVGSAFNSPGWGMQDAAGNRSGFDHNLTNWLGAQLGFTAVPTLVLTKDREEELRSGRASLVIATYSITDKRLKKVDFAGPYMLSRQGIMVRNQDREAYRTVADLRGKTVCVTSGSTSEVQVHAELGFPVTVVTKNTYEECRQALHAYQIDAVSTDQVLLFGLQKIDKDVTVPFDIVFGQEEQYGIGLPRGGKERCEAVKGKLLDLLTNNRWEEFFGNNLPGVPLDGHKPDPKHLKCWSSA